MPRKIIISDRDTKPLNPQSRDKNVTPQRQTLLDALRAAGDTGLTQKQCTEAAGPRALPWAIAKGHAKHAGGGVYKANNELVNG
jgi:hypothetical protein